MKTGMNLPWGVSIENNYFRVLFFLFFGSGENYFTSVFLCVFNKKKNTLHHKDLLYINLGII